jgi:hypothetical protein
MNDNFLADKLFVNIEKEFAINFITYMIMEEFHNHQE